MMMKEAIRERPPRQIQTGGLDDQSRFPALMGWETFCSQQLLQLHGEVLMEEHDTVCCFE
jgi:hypothetical protein